MITFSTEQYSKLAQMDITPQPAQMVRIFMVFKKAFKPTQTKEPKIVPIKRDNSRFHFVEWGGVNLE